MKTGDITPFTEHRQHLRENFDRVKATGESVVILKRGKPVARLVPPGPELGALPQERLKGTVELSGERKFTGCLKIRMRRTQRTADGKVRSTKHIFFLAPNVGEVKQEIYRGNTKVSEIVLSDYALKSGELGN